MAVIPFTSHSHSLSEESCESGRALGKGGEDMLEISYHITYGTRGEESKDEPQGNSILMAWCKTCTNHCFLHFGTNICTLKPKQESVLAEKKQRASRTASAD